MAASIEGAIMRELTESVASPAPIDARMRRKPAQPIHRPATSLPLLPPREEIRPIAPPRPAIERPAPPSKGVEDLKSILPRMAAKTGAEREQKKSQHRQALKGTLAEVLQKSKQPTPSEEKKPFEVSEDALRKVLKGEA